MLPDETDSRESPPSATTASQPQATCDFKPQHCLPFLRAFEKELMLQYPTYHRYLHARWVLHPTTGKKAVESADSIAVIEAADLSPPGLATPRRADRALARTPLTLVPASPGPALTPELDRLYKVMPAVIEDIEYKIAALVLGRILSTQGREALQLAAPGRGSAMLEILERRGTPDESTVEGNTLRILRLSEMTDATRTGVAKPPSAQSWAAFEKTLTAHADAAGGIPPEEKHTRLLTAIYQFDEALRDRVIRIVPPGSDPAALHAAVTTFFDGEDVAARLRLQLVGDTTTHAALAAERARGEELQRRVRELERRPPRESDPSTLGRAPNPSVWDQARHRPCTRWGKTDRCNGRHFDGECPDAPAPAKGGRGGRGKGEKGGHDRLRGRGRGRGGAPPGTAPAPAAAPAAAAAAASATPSLAVSGSSAAARDFAALYESDVQVSMVLAVARADDDPQVPTLLPPGLPHVSPDAYARHRPRHQDVPLDPTVLAELGSAAVVHAEPGLVVIDDDEVPT